MVALGLPRNLGPLGQKTAASQALGDPDACRGMIVVAVEQRLRGAQLQRADGIILGSVDVDDFDVTLC